MSDEADLRDFLALAHRIVWCTLATVDAAGRPRSRVVHPVWELTPTGLLGRVCTRATPTKRAHIANSAFVSCSYWDPEHDVAVAECAARWDPEPERSWPVFSAHPAPVGFDPARMFAGGTADPEAAVLLLIPWRLRWGRAADLAQGVAHRVWRVDRSAPGRSATSARSTEASTAGLVRSR